MCIESHLFPTFYVGAFLVRSLRTRSVRHTASLPLQTNLALPNPSFPGGSRLDQGVGPNLISQFVSQFVYFFVYNALKLGFMRCPRPLNVFAETRDSGEVVAL